MSDKKLIKDRTKTAHFNGDYSCLRYEIFASREIIEEIDDAISNIEAKYPKKWEK